MIKLFKNELRKFLGLRRIYIVYLVTMLFSLLSILSNNQKSALFTPISAIQLLNTTYIMAIVVSIFSYSFILETENKTIKILRMKSIQPAKILFAKFLVGIVGMLILFLTVLIGTTAIASLIYEIKGVDVTFLKMHLSKELAIPFIAKVYFFQFLCSIFVFSVSFFISIIFNNIIFTPIATTIFIMILDTLNMVKRYFSLVNYIPLNSNNVFRELVNQPDFSNLYRRTLVCLIYSALLFLLSAYVYRKKDITA
ncbi:hypothetical protein [Pseudobacteroides cellulosolvens]|uniref:Uncharacterized protein n=2 Tax=Pseudobacteroides cellulosolvens TaxID=35825 RepID=A0A0L6JTC8_9FIRM|nr:hypothetical protein [Pseudobacteroides cellulosolvens]KNY28935.1 hypothetical protein Bccel_4209 [Pseudobacteroides cellulosolvens ATCC 35603 = DSM 2933]